ncbi:MAG: hypothetical protein ACE366_03195 [Bradymonadia bacterium]
MSLAISFLLVAFSILTLIVVISVGIGYLRQYGHGRAPKQSHSFDTEIWRSLALQNVEVSEPEVSGSPGSWRLEGTVTNRGQLALRQLIIHCQVQGESGPLLAFVSVLAPGEEARYVIEAPHLRADQLDDVLVYPAKVGLPEDTLVG